MIQKLKKAKGVALAAAHASTGDLDISFLALSLVFPLGRSAAFVIMSLLYLWTNNLA